jgi:hypothetical protein
LPSASHNRANRGFLNANGVLGSADTSAMPGVPFIGQYSS